MKIDYDAPYSSFFIFPNECLNMNTTVLLEFVLPGESSSLCKRILNSLEEAGILTIGDLLYLSQTELTNIRNLGKGSRSLLFSILQRAADDKDLIFKVVPPSKKVITLDPIDRIKARYLRKLQTK